MQNFVTQRRKKTQNRPKTPLFALLETASRVDARHEIILPSISPSGPNLRKFFTISRLCALILFFYPISEQIIGSIDLQNRKNRIFGVKKTLLRCLRAIFVLDFPVFPGQKRSLFLIKLLFFMIFLSLDSRFAEKPFKNRNSTIKYSGLWIRLLPQAEIYLQSTGRGVPYEVIRKKDRGFQGKRHFMSISCPHNPKLFICISMGFIHRLIQIIRYPPEKEFLRPVIAS